MATVSVGSNRQYSEGWDAIFKKGKTAKKQQSASRGTTKTTAKAKKSAGAKKRTASQKTARRSRGKG